MPSQPPTSAGVSSGRPIYDWQRFWVPRTGTVDLSDGGFLADPTSLLLRSSATKPRPLTELTDYRALVLLGEPGIGKSTTLLEEAERVAKQAVAENTISIHIDLRAYSSDLLLHNKVFESAEFMAWLRGSSRLVLHLDSLDEALLRIDSLASLLADELPRYPASRMSLRIACRTAVWPAGTLETALDHHWGDAAVGVFELAPLRRRDIVAAAAVQGIDHEAFIQELYAANAVPFAIKPLTLNLLFGIFKKEGRLPRSIADLYVRGCLKLCEESNQSRRDARRLGSLTAAQRLCLASRIAATTMLCNRYAIWTGPEADGVPEEDVPLSVLTGGREEGEFPAFDIAENSVREVLDTGLFTSRGGVRIGWAHQSYAEFLAALYLADKQVPPRNILKVLQHPAGGLVPQLAVVTAWISSIHEDVREALIQSEPVVLLRGDLTNWNEQDLAALVASLMTALEHNRVHDFEMGISEFYARLNHPTLASQLRPYIQDSSKNTVSRRVAIMIAEHCKLRELQPELLTLALDASADPYLRGRAVDALGTCGDDTVPAQMLPLARGELGSDPENEIKGYALEILWPKHLSADDLFGLITCPNEGFVGAYVRFLTKTLPNSLTAADLPVALKWAAAFVTEARHSGDFQRRSLADSIFVRAWKNLDSPGVIEPLVTYVFARLGQHDELFGGTSYRESESFFEDLKSDTARRRRFLLAAAQRRTTRIDVYHLMRARLLRRDDLQWILNICPGGPAFEAGLDAEMFCNMVEITCDLDDRDQFDGVYEAALKWPELWQRFRWAFEGVLLDSDDARQLRDTQRMMKELEENKPPPVTPPPAERVTDLLNRFESGDWEAWWRLNLELTLTPASTVYGSDLDYLISEMPAWLAADEPTRQRILNAAERYLIVGHTSIAQWIGTTSLRRNDLAAFRALLLLRQHDQAAYDRIAASTWAKWAPVVVALPKPSGFEKSKVQAEIVSDALRLAPVEFVGAVRQIMRAERTRIAISPEEASQISGASFFVLRELEGCWNSEPLKAGIFEELRDNANSEDQFGTILEALLTVQFAPARAYAIGLLAGDHAQTGPYIMTAAVVLARHCAPEAWPTIWRLLVGDSMFAQGFFLKIANDYRFHDSLFAPLNEQQLAELYVYLVELFQQENDPQHAPGQPHFVGPRESLAHLRDRMPQEIVSRGTVAAVEAMRWIVDKLPKLNWLQFRLLEAQQTMRMKTWSPLTPKELFRLVASKSCLLVQSADDLCALLVESLRKYEGELHGEQNPVRGLWDRQKGGPTFRPVEEDSLSDDVNLFLRRELVESGIVANREVEIARVPGAPIGKRTDIRVNALRRSADGSAYDTITAVIEAKGCWNTALFTALKDQLYNDYMLKIHAPVGIYLVGWFDKAKWDSNDRRRRDAPDCTLREAQCRLDDQAAMIPAGFLVRSVVVDCHAP
jgi:predicted NACHT family NTPase